MAAVPGAGRDESAPEVEAAQLAGPDLPSTREPDFPEAGEDFLGEDATRQYRPDELDLPAATEVTRQFEPVAARDSGEIPAPGTRRYGPGEGAGGHPGALAYSASAATIHYGARTDDADRYTGAGDDYDQFRDEAYGYDVAESYGHQEEYGHPDGYDDADGYDHQEEYGYSAGYGHADGYDDPDGYDAPDDYGHPGADAYAYSQAPRGGYDYAAPDYGQQSDSYGPGQQPDPYGADPYSADFYAADRQDDYAEESGASPRRNRSMVLAAVVGAVAFVAVALGGLLGWRLLAGADDDAVTAANVAGSSAATSSAVAPAPEAAPPPPSPSATTAPTTTATTPAPLPAAAEPCGGADAGGRAAIGTDVTSCGFAEAVRDAYLAEGPPDATGSRTVEATSPVTGRAYSMECAADGDIVTCSGAQNAIVYVY